MTTQTNKAVSTAVQNTKPEEMGADDPTKLNGKTLGEVLKDLDKGDLAKAYEAVNEAYDIQWGKDGIEEVQAKLTGLQGKVGEKVYAIAKVAMVHCKDHLVIARSYFLALCTQAEEMKTKWYTGKYKEEKPIGQLIPLWSQYKSAIAKGMEKGLDPNALIEGTKDAPRFATAAQYRAEVQRLEKESKGANERDEGGTSGKSDGQVATGLSVVVSGWSPKMRAAMEVMCKAFNALGHEEQDKFASQILDIAAAAVTYKNEHKSHGAPVTGQVMTDASGNVTGTTSSDETVGETVDPGTVAALQAAVDSAKGPIKAPETEAADESRKGGKRRGTRAA